MKNILKRVTSSGKYIAEIDGLRFLAIFLVIIFHSNIWSDELYGAKKTTFWYMIDMGNIGVQFFFVISGFIISMPFIKSYCNSKKIDIKKYFLRRLTRLEPPYLIAILIYYLIAIFLSQRDFLILVTHYLATIFYLHGFLFDCRSIINSVAWSLEVEIQFYIIAPLVFYLFKIDNKKLLLFILATLTFLWPFLLNSIGMNYLNVLGYFHFFIAGA
jgi:peptidoglycan/LPS O-acetylase OafA/YrhL